LIVGSVLPLIMSLVWLLIVGSALASYRLGWGRAIRMALVWLAIFGGLYLLTEWYMLAREYASALM
jgi:hypothetical protein